VGDDLSVIASGPTVADTSTYAQAIDALVRHGGLETFPPRVVSRLQAGARHEIEDTPKPGDPRLARGLARVVGSRATAMEGATAAAAAHGYDVVRIDRAITGESRVAALRYFDDVRSLAAARTSGAPLCIVSSGETTVRVVGHGRGGRNQEFALALVEPLAQFGREAVCASVGTDGVDGPTDAAGAVVDGASAERARRRGLAASSFLDDNNAYAFFDALDGLVRTGPTGTNVGDLQVLLLA
jgi:hydroxypyruvate reductase